MGSQKELSHVEIYEYFIIYCIHKWVAWVGMSDKIDGNLHLKGPIRQTLDKRALVDMQADG